MRRGRIFIYLALIIILAVGAGAYYLFLRPKASPTPPAAQITPQVQYVGIITAGQNISAGTLITDGMLSSIQIPQNKLVQGLFTNKADVVNYVCQDFHHAGSPNYRFDGVCIAR